MSTELIQIQTPRALSALESSLDAINEAIATNISQNSGVVIQAAGASESAQSFPMTQPDKAAQIILDGIERDKFQVYVGRDANMMNLLYRLSPRRATKFMYNQMKGLLPG